MKERHYSERLGRIFVLGDWLFSTEALDLLSENAGRRVSHSNLPTLLAGGIRSQLFSPRRRIYLYDDLCCVVVAATAGRPRDPQLPVTATVRAQRAFRDRERKARQYAQQETLADLRRDEGVPSDAAAFARYKE